MKKIVLLTLPSVFLLSAMFIPAGFSAIGVKEGDWAKYDIEAEVDVPEEMEGITGELEIEWIKAEVESVSDTTVTMEITIHYENGTEETGTTEDAIESAFIIKADLGEGDEATAPFFGPEMTVYINGTVSRTYAGASREVNYVEITTEQYPMTEEYPMTSTVKAYWDKATGFMCEVSTLMSGEYEGETVEVSVSYEMTETNMWEAEVAPFWMEWWLWAIVAVVIIALAGAVYLLKKRKPPTQTAPTLPPEPSSEYSSSLQLP